jgi:hypothetical protein
LKAPGNKRLKLNCDEPLLNSAFNLNLRRYTMVIRTDNMQVAGDFVQELCAGLGITVGRCGLNR